MNKILCSCSRIAIGLVAPGQPLAATCADPGLYDATLSALGKPEHEWAVHLDELEKSLVATGTDPTEARTAILTTIRNQRVPTGWELDIVRVGRDIGAVMGTGIVQETWLLTNALGSGYESMAQYGLSRGLTAPDLLAVHNYLEGGALGQAVDFILSRPKARFAGKYEELRAAPP